MSNFIKPVTAPQQIPDFSAADDGQTFAYYTDQAARLDLSSIVLHGGAQSIPSQHSSSNTGVQPVFDIVAENGRERSRIRSEIAHLNAGHSDPTLIAVDIREINQKMAVVALKQQVEMKVEQAGIGAVKQLISAQ